MTDKLAGMFGSYVDAKFMRGLKVLRVSIDVPIERANEFLTAFGAPDGVDPVPVAIARMNLEALKRREAPEVQEEPEQAEKPTVYQRSQIAYLKFRDPQFISWFASTHLDNVAVDRTNGYEPHIKSYLGIKSKAELDVEGPKALAFDRLLTDFDMRGLAR